MSTDDRKPVGGVVVLGMHRSGTSCLTGCLQAAGLELGEVNTASRRNVKGNRESLAIMRVNDAVLGDNGGSWRRPPLQVRWSEENLRGADTIIAHLSGPDRWGFKDPRTLLTLSGWLGCMNGATLVASFRHPFAVAESLRRRDPTFSTEEALELWRIYNGRLCELASDGSVELVCFDWPQSKYLQAVIAIAERLNLSAPQKAVAFYEATLREHTALGDHSLPAGVKVLLDQLLELAGGV